MTTEALMAKWHARAIEYHKLMVRVDGAALCEEIIADLRQADVETMNDLLTQSEAVQESGYTMQQLRRLAKEGKLLSSGRGRGWRVARRDLPRRPSLVAPPPTKPHLLGAKAEQVVRESAGASNGTPR